MYQKTEKQPRRSLIRRIWKPATAAGTGGAVTLIWWEEILLFGAEILSIIAISILAGAVFLFNLLVFRARHPRREDLNRSKNQKGRFTK